MTDLLQGSPHPASGEVGPVRDAGSGCCLRQSVALQQSDAQTRPDKVVSIRSEGSSSRQQNVQVTAHDGLELAEDQLVHDGSVMTQPAVNND